MRPAGTRGFCSLQRLSGKNSNALFSISGPHRVAAISPQSCLESRPSGLHVGLQRLHPHPLGCLPRWETGPSETCLGQSYMTQWLPFTHQLNREGFFQTPWRSMWKKSTFPRFAFSARSSSTKKAGKSSTLYSLPNGQTLTHPAMRGKLISH